MNAEALKTLQDYVRINTSNPPGDVTKAADFLVQLLNREGIPVTRYESGPGRSIVLARLKGDGRAARRSCSRATWTSSPPIRRAGRMQPFGAEIADGRMWGRGTIDMKGIGVTYLYAFLELHRQHVAADAATCC